MYYSIGGGKHTRSTMFSLVHLKTINQNPSVPFWLDREFGKEDYLFLADQGIFMHFKIQFKSMSTIYL